MNKLDENATDCSTSGYTGNLNGELGAASPIQTNSSFSQIQECYVSKSGHTRLFTAMRYGKLYVLKGIKPDFLYTPVYRQALVKEFEIGLQLDHPNICRTIGIEDVPECGTVIVMEHVDGMNLKEFIASGKLDADTAIKITSQLADALDYMHSKQIIHRDLKPSNVMITHNGHNAKIIDFSLSDSDSFAVLKQPAGTSGYIAPEQFLPGARASVESDIYSFGMLVRDLAEATGNKDLKSIAKACTRRNPATRPLNKKQIFSATRTSSRERIVFVVLAILSLFFATYICINLHNRSRTAAKESEELQDTVSGENIIKDVYSWPQNAKR